MDKKYLIMLGLCFIVLVGAIQITNFDGYGTSSNLTFTDDENQTLNLSINIHADVTGAYINLSGYNDGWNKTLIPDLGQDGDEIYNLPNCGDGNLSTFCLTDNNLASSCSYDNSYDCASFDNNYTIPSGTNRTKVTVYYTCPYNYDGMRMAGLYWKSASFNVNWQTIIDYNIASQHIKCSSVGVGDGTYTFYINDALNGELKISPTISTYYSSKSYSFRIYDVKVEFYNSSNNWGNYTSSPYIQINNTKIWNITGEFSTTKNKTDDFSSILNSALNGGLCDCTGCVLSSNDCLLENIFHSDTAGILQYSDINITYTPAPFPTLESPANDSYSPSTKEFNCSATDEEGLANLTFYFYNSTGNLNLSTTINLSNTYNSTTYSMTFNSTDTFTWGCSAYNNNSRSWWADANFTINVDIDKPVINSLSPSNDSWDNNKDNITFYYTPSHSTDTIHTCKLYSNFTGTWEINQTDNSINTSNQNNFTLNLSGLTDNDYEWTIWCNTTNTGNSAFSQSGNYTLNIDTTLPTMNNMSITTTKDQTQFNFTSNITDTNLDSCKYSIWTGSTPGTNTSFICNVETIATAPGFGTYTLYLYGTDLASNENSQSLAFTTSVTATTTGGGGSSTTIISSDKGWIMESSKGQAKFEADMSKGTERKFNIQFENLRDSSKTITLSCQDIKGLACQYVEFPEQTFELALLKDTKQSVSFIINLPETAKNGDYQFNIRALDEDARDGTVTVFLGIGTLGIFQAFISKVLFTRTNFGFPYALIFFPALIFMFIVSSKLIKKGTPLKPIWVILISSIISIGLVLLI